MRNTDINTNNEQHFKLQAFMIAACGTLLLPLPLRAYLAIMNCPKLQYCSETFPSISMDNFREFATSIPSMLILFVNGLNDHGMVSRCIILIILRCSKSYAMLTLLWL